MSELPFNRREMIEARYKYVATKPCWTCSAPVEIWKTTHGKTMLFDPPPPGCPNPENIPSIVHYGTCKSPKRRATIQPTNPAERQAAVEQLAERLKARVVLVLDDDGHTWAAKHGLAPEDVRHDLITAANKVRREMEQGR